MNFWQWVLSYWKGYTILIATPEKHYRVVFIKGKMRINVEIPETRGASLDMVWFDDIPKKRNV